MIPRVWRHFFKNLAWPLGFVLYLFAVAIGSAYANSLYIGAGLIVIGIFIVLPILVYLIRDMWRDAKEKVERENYEMMRRIKGNDYSDLYEK